MNPFSKYLKSARLHITWDNLICIYPEQDGPKLNDGTPILSVLDQTPKISKIIGIAKDMLGLPIPADLNFQDSRVFISLCSDLYEESNQNESI